MSETTETKSAEKQAPLSRLGLDTALANTR